MPKPSFSERNLAFVFGRTEMRRQPIFWAKFFGCSLAATIGFAASEAYAVICTGGPPLTCAAS
jgi:hypothetical protein